MSNDPQTTTVLLATLLLLCGCNNSENKLEELALGSAETGAAGCHHLLENGSLPSSDNYDEFQKRFMAAIRKGCEE